MHCRININIFPRSSFAYIDRARGFCTLDLRHSNSFQWRIEGSFVFEFSKKGRAQIWRIYSALLGAQMINNQYLKEEEELWVLHRKNDGDALKNKSVVSNALKRCFIYERNGQKTRLLFNKHVLDDDRRLYVL